ncbi:alpha/beta fold hydrolase [Maridesulfovibrio bastinii]|uniref:alpha/beta fold hydrolase n=1 Tax=Maridesulfovibrio bastinii TaxID=47157 RepID=UPI000406DEA4|nr:alpha/beta hydrolase [Maridesulfovibrio bastinii]
MYKRFALWIAAAAMMLVLYKLPLKKGDFNSLESLETYTVKVNGVSLGYKIAGEGDHILLIMGYGYPMNFWDFNFIKLLSKNHRVIIFDNRGIGSSSSDSRSFSIDLFASDAYVLIRELGLKKVSVLGWSMGAVVAGKLAADYPESVNKLILYAGFIDQRPVLESLAEIKRIPSDEFEQKAFPVKWVANHPMAFDSFTISKPDFSSKAVSRQHSALAGWSGGKDLFKRIKTPALVVYGEDDWVVPAKQSLEIANLISGSWRAGFKGAGHWLMFQNPYGLVETIDNFLSVNQDLPNKKKN